MKQTETQPVYGRKANSQNMDSRGKQIDADYALEELLEQGQRVCLAGSKKKVLWLGKVLKNRVDLATENGDWGK